MSNKKFLLELTEQEAQQLDNLAKQHGNRFKPFAEYLLRLQLGTVPPPKVAPVDVPKQEQPKAEAPPENKPKKEQPTKVEPEAEELEQEELRKKYDEQDFEITGTFGTFTNGKYNRRKSSGKWFYTKA